MRIAGGLVRDAAQTKTLVRVIGRRLQPPIVERQRFREPVFEEQLPIVSVGDRVFHQTFDAGSVEASGFKKQVI